MPRKTSVVETIQFFGRISAEELENRPLKRSEWCIAGPGILGVAILLVTLGLTSLILVESERAKHPVPLQAEAEPEAPQRKLAPLFALVPITSVCVGSVLVKRNLYRRELLLDKKDVTLRSRRFSGKTQEWTEPLKGFIILTYEIMAGKNHNVPATVVKLYHRDPAKSIIGLSVLPGRIEEARAASEKFALALGLPISEGTFAGPGHTIRAPEDLDKSVGDLVQEGKIKYSFDPKAPLPEGLDLSFEGDTTEVTLVGRVPLIMGSRGVKLGLACFVIGIISFVAGAGVVRSSAPGGGLLGLLGCLFMFCGAVWAFLAAMLPHGDTRLYIQPHSIRVTKLYRNRRREKHLAALDPARVEGVEVRGRNAGGVFHAFRWYVILPVDTGPITISCRNQAVALWLRDYLVALLASQNTEQR